MTAPDVETRIERIIHRDGDVVHRCEAVEKAHCAAPGDYGTFRFERVRSDTGEVWRKFLCLGAAAALAKRLDVPFPPIAPGDLQDYLEARNAVARTAP